MQEEGGHGYATKRALTSTTQQGEERRERKQRKRAKRESSCVRGDSNWSAVRDLGGTIDQLPQPKVARTWPSDLSRSERRPINLGGRFNIDW